jgi:hypothetical protein
MSSAEADEVCASCGKVEVDDVKLKKCGCKLVKYCSVDCQRNHRSQHKKACKKRMVELRDEKLFEQPDGSHLGECPICCLPLPLDPNKSKIYSCCCQRICNGCGIANQLREAGQGLELKCPYCREPLPDTDDGIDQNFVKRVKANDPVALVKKGIQCRHEGNCYNAFQYYRTAAGLGDADAHFELSVLYLLGEGVEKNEKKTTYHMEEAAIGGHHLARFNLGVYDAENERFDRAVKHYIIAAKLGLDDALEKVKKYFLKRLVSKEDYAAALRGHQAAVDATKSKQREEAYAFLDKYRITLS